MSIVPPALAVAFAAFCVWLAVRIVNRRERWAKWTLAVTLSLPVLYAVSFGPACWITSRVNVGVPLVNVVYLPMLWIRDVSPEFIGDGILWYSRIGSARGWCWSGDHEWMDFSDLFFGDSITAYVANPAIPSAANDQQMTIILPTLAVAFAAFCLWLGVRIVNRGERWAKRTAATVVALPVLYVLSFGPACWISERTESGEQPISAVYQPMFWLWMRTKYPGTLVKWYAMAGTANGSVAINTVDGSFLVSW